MPTIDTKKWDAIRKDFEAGASVSQLATKYGVDKNSIHHRKTRHGWIAGDPTSYLLLQQEKRIATTFTPLEIAQLALADLATLVKSQMDEKQHKDYSTALLQYQRILTLAQPTQAPLEAPQGYFIDISVCTPDELEQIQIILQNIENRKLEADNITPIRKSS